MMNGWEKAGVVLVVALWGLSCAVGRHPASPMGTKERELFSPARYGALLEAIPVAHRTDVVRSLTDTPGNWSALVNALERAEGDERTGVAFLIAHMSPADRATVTADVLLDHVRYAYLARRTLPWGADIPDSLFLEYVLPFRATLEPIQRWRGDFYERLLPVVRDAKTASEAAIKVNYYLAEQLHYEPNQLRTQGPYEMLKRGFGRCGELSVIYTTLCRSVCVPARVAFIPRWPMAYENHQWTEVWDGRWHFTGSGEPQPELLNQAWFEKAAARTAKIYAQGFKPTPIYTEQISFEWRNLVDVTAAYGPMDTLEVTVTEEEQPAEGMVVHCSVWNDGGWMSIANAWTDAVGKAVFPLRTGVYFVTAGTPRRNTWGIAQIEAGEKTSIQLEMSDIKEEEIWHAKRPDN